MQQKARLKHMDRFKENPQAILVSTDVAARGLDIPNVELIIHFQVNHSFACKLICSQNYKVLLNIFEYKNGFCLVDFA